MDDRCVEGVGIGQGHGQADAPTLGKLVSRRQQFKNQGYRFSGRDRLLIGLKVAVKGQIQVIIGRLT
jgi:hypothetical protein